MTRSPRCRHLHCVRWPAIDSEWQKLSRRTSGCPDFLGRGAALNGRVRRRRASYLPARARVWLCVCERARAPEAVRLFVCLVPSECTRTLRAHAHVSTRSCAVGAWLCLHVRLCACAYVLKCARARYVLCVSVRARNGSISPRALSSACWACIWQALMTTSPDCDTRGGQQSQARGA